MTRLEPRRLRVAMYVAGDPDNDTRVLREADTLAAAGHDVVLIARVKAGNTLPAESRRASGVRLVRIRRDPGWSTRWRRHRGWIRSPWRASEAIARRWRDSLRDGPAGWNRVARQGLMVLLALPWITYRVAARALFAGSLPAPSKGGQLDYVMTMRRSLKHWVRIAPTIAPEADVHHGHDVTGLWAAVEAAKGTGALVVYDSHELYPESGRHARQGKVARYWLRSLERRLARHAVALVTVNVTLEQTLRRSLGIRRSVVVHNAPPRWTPPDPAPNLLREALGLPAGTRIALYHGGLAEDRGLLPLAEAVMQPGMDGVHLVFLGRGPFRDVLAACAADPRAGGRIHLLDPVPPDELAEWVASADVGVMPNQPVTANERLSTPNKLFESIAVGLPVVSSDFPERRHIILGDPGGPLGAVCDPTSPQAIAAAIRSILDLPAEERAALHERILRAADERWNWETEGARLVALYESLAEATS